MTVFVITANNGVAVTAQYIAVGVTVGAAVVVVVAVVSGGTEPVADPQLAKYQQQT